MFSLLFFIGLSLLASSAPAFAQTPRAERPTYAIGDKWIRPGGVFELIRIENDIYIFSNEGRWEHHLTKDLGLVKSVGPQGLLEFHPSLPLEWPLEVGKKGSRQIEWQTLQSGFNRIYVNWEVESYEDVQVPGGSFKAFKIHYSFQVGPPGASGARQWRELFFWYSPEVKQIIKSASPNFKGMNWNVVAIDRPEMAPLDLALREPKDQARFDRESIVLAGKATSGKGIARVTVALNGREVASRGERAGARNELLFDVPIKLNEGRNVLIVTALDTKGEARQEARTLFYESRGPSASEQALSKQLEEERKKAAEIAFKAEREKKRLEELAQKRLDEEKKKADQLARLDQEKRRKAEELARKQEEERKKAAEIALKAEQERKRPDEERRRTAELARLEQEKRKKAEQLASLPPMQVTISSPANQARVENESIGLAGLVSGGKGVSRVVVTLNGSELSRLEERSPLRSMPVNLPVKLRDGQNTLVVTATDADGLIQQEVRTVHYEKRAPLTVAFRYPEDRSRVNEETSVVAALVTSSKGVAKVSVILNGAEVHQQSERSPQSSVAVTAPVTLKEGANAIVVNAIEADGNARQEIRTVFYDRPKETVVAPKKPLPEPPRDRWAVVIGVGRYESPEVPRLRYTVPDAEAIYDALIKSAGFKKDHVLLLTDRTEKRPTLRNVKWALGTFLARSAKKDDTVIIFFAGHGAPEVDQRGVERDGFSKYLVPSDAEPDDLYSTALPMDELQTIFARLEAERVVVFLDACYSGAAGGRTFASKKTRSAHVDDLFLERATSSKGRAIITASRPSEVSIELPDLGHGIFTYYVLQALKGAADLNRDGIVSLQELYEYVERQVSQKARAVGGNQHPVMKGELEGVLPLVRVKAK